jgi:glutamine amidotransferase
MSSTVIVDYGMGNLRSVYNALDLLGAEVCISSQPEDILAADRLILPGVGAFGMAMNNLRQRGLIDPLGEKVMGQKVPFLAICLGMQLLAEEGLEHGRHKGLGWIQGQVIPFQKAGLGELRVPHVGWNEIQPKPHNPLFKGLGVAPEVYFVHSYHLITEDEDAVAATTHYGYPFAASLWRENIFATQFHPEKSQGLGLNMLRNFLAYSPK